MTIRIAGNYVSALEFAPGFSGSGHLQIVRAVGDGPLIEAEVQSKWLVTLQDWSFEPFGQLHGGPKSYIGDDDVIENADRYKAATLTLRPGQEEAYVWELLEQFHLSLSISGRDIDYDADQNSNS